MSESTHDLLSFLNDDALVLPAIKSKKHPEGKVYLIPSPDAETGLRLAGLANVAARVAGGGEADEEEVESLILSDTEERTFIQQVLGDAYQTMMDDGVSWVAIQRISQYAFAYFAVSPSAANRGVESGAFLGKKQALANREQRRKSSTGAKSAPQVSAGSRKPKPKTA